MKLYQASVLTTCPRRVTIYMAEKGISCEIVTVDIRGGEVRGDAYKAKNPSATVPVLELEDGSFIPDSAAIVEYLEERFPEPPMIGTTLAERGYVRGIERMASEFIVRNGVWIVNTDPLLKQRRPDYAQYPDAATYIVPSRDRLLEGLELAIGDKEFLAGDKVTVADCAMFAAVDTGKRLSNYEIPDAYPKLQRWFARFAQRPSAAYPDWAAAKA